MSCDDKTHYTAVDKMISNFEKENDTVTEYDVVADDIKVKRVLAVKDSSFFDVCIKVNESNINDINSYYAFTYKNYYKLNSNSGKGVVFCCSDQEAFKISGYKILELDPIIVK